MTLERAAMDQGERDTPTRHLVIRLLFISKRG